MARKRPSILTLTTLARALAVPTFAAAALAAPLAALAQETAQRSYSIAAGPLEDALSRFGRAANITLSFVPELTAGLRSNGDRKSVV